MANTDGPPFNGHHYHKLMKWTGAHSVVVSPEDPEANGLAKNFMKAMNKVWHIAHIKGKNHKQQLYKFLGHYQATPQSFTWKAPAKVLFNRQARVPLKNKPTKPRSQRKQKAYKDGKINTKSHNIKVGLRSSSPTLETFKIKPKIYLKAT